MVHGNIFKLGNFNSPVGKFNFPGEWASPFPCHNKNKKSFQFREPRYPLFPR